MDNTPLLDGRYIVVSRQALQGECNWKAKLRLRNSDNDIVTHYSRCYIPVTKDDEVWVEGNQLRLKLRNMDDNYVQIEPAWRCKKNLHINNEKISISIKEIENKDEFNQYQELTKFHYRGNGGVGRRVPLIAKMRFWDVSRIVGFVELSSSLNVNIARKKIINARFHDAEFGYQWDSWDMEASKKYTSAMVRISRCVVYPELRGLGLAVKLTEAAIEYAKKRWHLGGLRPCFIEIIAEMLRYWPFVKKAGFIKVGETEGNRHRVQGAMRYLLNRKKDGRDYPKGGGGVMSMHRNHAEQLAEIRRQKMMTIEQVIDLLGKPPGELTTEEWLSLHSIHQRKKPTYMLGLTSCAKTHLKEHTKPMLNDDIGQGKKSQKVVRNDPLATLCSLQITARVTPEESNRCRQVQEAFGIVRREFQTEVMQNFSAKFNAGEIILVTGASGVGKSIFMEAIYRACGEGRNTNSRSEKVAIDYRPGLRAKIARLQNPPLNKSPIELLGSHDLDQSMRILARAGLAEAQLFVRPAYALSEGQSYRLSLALALSKNPDILLVDKFCEPLDEYTSAAVCRKLRKTVAEDGICAVVATADARKILPELRPDRILLLLQGSAPHWVTQ